MALGKGIPVINGFDLNSKLPLDSRTVADTKENMNKLVTDGSVGDGQLCYCKADKKLYVLKDNVWSEVGGGGGISVIELNDKNGTIASAQLGKINANPQNFAFKYNGKILLFTRSSSTTYQYCNNTTNSSDNNVMTTSTLLTIESSTGVYTISENVHNVVANSTHPVNGGNLTNIQVGSKVYSIPSGGIKTVAINYSNNTWDVSKVDLTKDYIINIDIGGSFVIGYKNEGYYLAYIVLNMLAGNIYYVVQNLTLNFDGTFTQSEIFFGKSGNDLKISYDHGGNPTTEKIIGCPPLPSDASTKTYTLQAANGVLTWTGVIGDINTILDNINGEVI